MAWSATESGGRSTARASEALQVPEECGLITRVAASPEVALRGELIDLRMDVRPMCVGSSAPTHVVLVLDASGSMAGEPQAVLRDVAGDWIATSVPDANPTLRVGVVEFNNEARTLCALTTDVRKLHGCLRRLRAQGGTDIAAGIDEGLRLLRAGRAASPDLPAPREVLVFLTDGENNAGCGPVAEASTRAAAEDVRRLGVCLGTSCDSMCLRSASSSPREFFEARGVDRVRVARVFEGLGSVFRVDVPFSMIVTATVAAEFRLVPDDFAWATGQISSDARSIEWRFDQPPLEGVGVRWRVRSTQAGYHGTGAGAAAFVDRDGRHHSPMRLPEPNVLVLDPRVVATVTATTTAGAVATATPGLAPTPRATPSQERGSRHWILLPYVQSQLR
jgi:Mg-chelatase subunit ChlD